MPYNIEPESGIPAIVAADRRIADRQYTDNIVDSYIASRQEADIVVLYRLAAEIYQFVL